MLILNEPNNPQKAICRLDPYLQNPHQQISDFVNNQKIK